MNNRLLRSFVLAALAAATPWASASTPSGDALYRLVQAYSAFGDHRTGSAADAQTAAWFAQQLRERGAQVRLEPFDFAAEEAQAAVTIAGQPVQALPLRGHGQGEVDDEHPFIAEVPVLDKDEASKALLDAIAQAHAAGARSVVVATRNPLGELQVPNATDAAGDALPVVLVPGRMADGLRHGPVRLHFSGHDTTGHSGNVIGEFGDVSRRPIVIATPLSCWFACAAERGSGVAVALALAQHLAPRFPVLVVGTTGHELLPRVGLQHYLANHHVEPLLLVHLGANVALGEAGADGGVQWAGKRVVGLRMPPPVAQRVLPALAAMQLKPYVNPPHWLGEGAIWAGATDAPMMSFVGAGAQFHTPADTPEKATGPALLEQAADGIAHAVDAWAQAAPLAMLATLRPRTVIYSGEQVDAVSAKAGVARDCFWAGVVSPRAFNVLYPDDGVTYWAAQYSLPVGAQLSLEGDFPHARYMSINAYDGQGQPLDRIVDALIAPQPGSRNPFAPGAERDVSPRAYRLQVRERELVAGQAVQDAAREPNTLYVPRGESSMSLVYRVYVPDAGRGATGGVRLPHPVLTLAGGHRLEGEALCRAIVRKDGLMRDVVVPGQALKSMFSLPSKARHAPAQPQPHWNAFFNPALGIANLFIGTPFEAVRSHMDITRRGGFYGTLDNIYLSMYVDARYDDVLVLHGKAPTTPRTLHGDTLMGEGDLRYWSICKYRSLADTAVDSCVYDEQVPRDAQGDITVVLSQPAKRPANARPECGVAWLPWGIGDSLGNPDGGFLLWRQMMPSEAFRPHSAFEVHRPGDEEATLGAYYLHAAYQSRADFERRGCERAMH
jgi:hypothetical protein